MIPCHNCLILPICRYRKVVDCHLIYNWYVLYNYSDESLIELNKYLLNYVRIIKEGAIHIR